MDFKPIPIFSILGIDNTLFSIMIGLVVLIPLILIIGKIVENGHNRVTELYRNDKKVKHVEINILHKILLVIGIIKVKRTSSKHYVGVSNTHDDSKGTLPKGFEKIE